MLSGVVEFDVAGPRDFQVAKFVKWKSLGPKTECSAVWVELYICRHVGFGGSIGYWFG